MGRIAYDQRGLQNGRSGIRPLLSCINDFMATQRSFGLHQTSATLGKMTSCSLLIDRAARQHHSTVDFECGRTLVGSWANSLVSRTQDRFSKICGYTERLRHICSGWQSSFALQPGTYVNVFDNPDYNYTCQLLYGQCAGLEDDERDIYTKSQQVSYVCGYPAPQSFLTPAIAYKWPTSSATCGCNWYQSPTSLSWLGKHVNYGGFSAFPTQPKTWSFPQGATISESWDSSGHRASSYTPNNLSSYGGIHNMPSYTGGPIVDRWDPPSSGLEQRINRYGTRWG
jgi:hypothetical protein